MRLHRLKLVNFRQHADTEIVFGPGITAIIGPNGSGKTTLLEAIAWAFYGNPAARGSRDTIRWNRAPARSSVRVEVDFSLGAHEFRVVRGLYNAELFQDRSDAPMANSQQEVSARIERLLGMTRDEFFNTYFTGQKELAVMASLGPADRGRFLSRILGYERLRLAQEKLREARSGLRGELEGLERGLADPAVLEEEHRVAEERLAGARAALESAERIKQSAEEDLEREGPNWTRVVELRESVLSLEGEAKVAERDVTEARREFQRLDRELAEALGARGRLVEIEPLLERVAPLKSELEQLEQEAKAAGRRRALSGQLKELTEQIGRLEDRWRGLEGTGGALERARVQVRAVREELERDEKAEEDARVEWVRNRQDAETKHLSLRDQYKDLRENRDRVIAAGAGGECPVCKRPLGEVYENTLATLERQLEEVEVKGKFFRRLVEQLEGEPKEVVEARARAAECRRRVEEALTVQARCEDRVREREALTSELEQLAARRSKLEAELAGLPDAYDAERHEEIREELRTLEPTVAMGLELKVKAEAAERLVGEAEAAERSLSECEARVAALRGQIADLGFSEERYAAARQQYEDATRRVREAELEVASMRGELRAAEAAVTAALDRVRERNERAMRIEEIRRELLLHEELDRALRDLRQELNAAMRPELSDRASSFLSDLTDGRYNELELDEQYQITVVEDGRAKPVISGGEEDVANLVLRLAISEMVAERAGQPLSLLVLDEIFGSLDEHRRQNVVDLLRALADRFPQVVLITHIETVREGVDRVLRVEYDPERGAATLTEELQGGDADVAA
ncbi:MAG: AAA family ATPase [Gemmatimonadales bacterium]